MNFKDMSPMEKVNQINSWINLYGETYRHLYDKYEAPKDDFYRQTWDYWIWALAEYCLCDCDPELAEELCTFCHKEFVVEAPANPPRNHSGD